MKDIPPSLVRAFALRLRELEMKGKNTSQRSHSGAGGECTGAKQVLHIQHGAGAGNFKIGLHRPALTGVDMKLFKSPVLRMARAKELAQKKNRGVKP